MWDEISYPFPNFSGCTVEVWEWISNFIPQFMIAAITYWLNRWTNRSVSDYLRDVMVLNWRHFNENRQPFPCHGVIIQRGIPRKLRLLHSPGLVAFGLSVGYGTWLTIGWHHPFVICLSKYNVELSQSQWIGGHVIGGNIHRFHRPLTARLHSPKFNLCKKIVKQSKENRKSGQFTQSTYVGLRTSIA